MSSVVGEALGWLAERLQPSGDAAMRGLEQDLSRETTLDGGWWRVCETAWTLGFVELQLVPMPDVADRLAAHHDFAPRPWPMSKSQERLWTAQSTWSFHVISGGRTIATLRARRRLSRVDFEPLHFVTLVQGLVSRFATRSPGEAAPARGEPARDASAVMKLLGASAGPPAASSSAKS